MQLIQEHLGAAITIVLALLGWIVSVLKVLSQVEANAQEFRAFKVSYERHIEDYNNLARMIYEIKGELNK